MIAGVSRLAEGAAIALVLLAGTAASSCLPKKPPPVHVESSASLDEETLNALVRELVPLVEEAAGKPFVTVPHARLGRPTDLATLLEDEFLDVMSEIYEAPDWVLDGLARSNRGAAHFLVGKYGIETKTLYLSPESLDAILLESGISPARIGDIARVVLAHEMTHALQDQHASGSEIWGALQDIEALYAMQAVTEGHANFAERRVAERLGALDVARAMDAGQGWDESGPTSPSAYPLWASYGQGLAFVRYHHEHGGMEKVWETLQHPPRTTTMIFRPETYASAVEEPTDWSAAMEGIEQELTEGPWVTLRTMLGEHDLRLATLGCEPAEVDEVLAHVRTGFAKQAVRQDRQAQFWVLEFDGAEWPGRFVDLFSEARVEPWEGVEADRAVEIVIAPPGLDDPSMETRGVWIARGSSLVVVQVQGFRPGIRMRAAVGRLVRQIDEAEAAGVPGG